MLKHMKEKGKYAEITGFRDAQIEDVDELMNAIRPMDQLNTAVQFFNAELIATREHIYFAVLDALLGFENGWNISKNLAMEILLYASTQRQIRKALDLIGIKRGRSNVALVIVGVDQAFVGAVLSAITERMGGHPDETVLELSKAKTDCIQKSFGISDTEITTVTGDNPDSALVNLVVEKMALLAALR
jgi:tRNA threonylcarbamoyladenosine modification (KEOPS) complex Cgi121 subunit